MLKRQEIVKRLKETLEEDRFRHTLRVEKIALSLAKKYGLDESKVSLAALLHDCARRYHRHELLVEAKRLGLSIDPIQEFEPKLLHAEISAHLARTEFKVRSKEVLHAINRHTVGAPKMSLLDKVIYLADHIEEGRAFPGVKRIRALAFRDLDRAIVESVTRTLLYLLENDLPVFHKTIETRNRFLLGI
ncbi:hypothetical protein A2311_03325 [candidate division WOR-1 bacterium RIFOXYB2_FULL_48_7]|uniref:bis(5'-nucleosyl)-tetraphosphatase (symmetrical) n=1 Tax=candidate division WOR-1 bacterium RIFOXYB2_FULL_48_7 TaxID=1802583 RepID=A0A1F4TV29_UNCSA|nr:MAG: hypothetical protein A2311_03325 [candidate division WOR-1 bacterium RIFOXYB2_FULL_48_7]